MKRMIRAAISNKWSENLRDELYDKKKDITNQNYDEDTEEEMIESAIEEFRDALEPIAKKAERIANSKLPKDQQISIYILSDGMLVVSVGDDVGYDFVDENGELIEYDDEYELADKLVEWVNMDI